MPMPRKREKSTDAHPIADSYDVVILGGGPAGLATAISLRRQADVSVLLVEAAAPEQERIGESCPPDTLLLLEQLGLTQRFRRAGHLPCPGYASVWGRPQPGYNDFIVNPLGPAWRLDRQAFDGMLMDAAIAAGVQVFQPARFVKAAKADNTQDGYSLELLHQSTRQAARVKACFVVDATGINARFARALGIHKLLDDQLFAMVSFADIAAGTFTRQVLIEAVPEGWWYAALLPANRLVRMLITEKHTLTQCWQGDKGHFERALAASAFLGPALRPLSLVGHSYHTWSVCSSLLPQVQGPDWLAVGDAASSYDPISAGGIYKALSDGLLAGQRVAAFFQDGPQTDRSYADRISRRYQGYWQNRSHLYALEQRWPEAHFWKNRQAKQPHFAQTFNKRIS